MPAKLRWRYGALLGLASIPLAVSPVHAVLGQASDSVERDRVHLSARVSSNAVRNYTIHTLNAANGGVVREFARADGTVFAVTWRGPGRPDLRQLLGESFDYMQTAIAHRHRMIRAPISVSDSNLVIRSGGRPGAFFGAAYRPDLAPADFSLDELQSQ